MKLPLPPPSNGGSEGEGGRYFRIKGERIMKKARIAVALLVLLCVSTWAAIGIAADFPQKPIRMIIVYAAGGGTDVLCRAFQPAFEKILGQRILIENIPAGGTKITPSGSTLFLRTFFSSLMGSRS